MADGYLKNSLRQGPVAYSALEFGEQAPGAGRQLCAVGLGPTNRQKYWRSVKGEAILVRAFSYGGSDRAVQREARKPH